MTTKQQHLIRCLLVLWKFGRPLNFDAELDVSLPLIKKRIKNTDCAESLLLARNRQIAESGATEIEVGVAAITPRTSGAQVRDNHSGGGRLTQAAVGTLDFVTDSAACSILEQRGIHSGDAASVGRTGKNSIPTRTRCNQE